MGRYLDLTCVGTYTYIHVRDTRHAHSYVQQVFARYLLNSNPPCVRPEEPHVLAHAGPLVTTKVCMH